MNKWLILALVVGVALWWGFHSGNLAIGLGKPELLQDGLNSMKS